MKAQWTVRDCDAADVKRLAADADVCPIVATVLLNRGIKTTQQALDFMNPSLDQLHDPLLLPDMHVAATRIAQAVRDGQLMSVYGDYDADGITATAVLVRALRALKANVEYRLPHRQFGGYDINAQNVEELAAAGVKLIITCDCGINALEAIKRADELGLDVIVTDHHEPGCDLPDALAVVNPKRADSEYPFRELAGVGVAFKLAQAVVRALGYAEDRFVSRFTDLVALGTVADVVPLIQENRALVKHGLSAVSSSKKVGIQALLKALDLQDKTICSHHISYGIAPRLNAAGRMDDATIVLKLLLTGEPGKAETLTRQIEHHNSDRKLDQQKIVREAIKQAESKDLSSTRVLVLASEGWNKGTIGLAAGNMVTMYGRPAILFSIDPIEGEASGSGRSIEAFDLLEGLRRCDSILTRCGGHALAAGVSLPVSNIKTFEELINAHAESTVALEDLRPTIHVDAELDPSDITFSLVNALTALEPFGAGNQKPVFMSQGMRVERIQTVGDGSHLRMLVKGSNSDPIWCIGFNLGEYFGSIDIGSTVDLCYSININTFNGTESLQLTIKDIR